jgi:hypothetical protein
VEQCSVASDRVIATIDVAGVELPGDEAAIDPSPPATGGLQRHERTAASAEKVEPPA